MIEMILLRIYLLSGLVIHKVVWEMLKRHRRAEAKPRAAQSIRLRLIKTVKVAILLGIAAQTVLPELLPIAQDATLLRIIGTAIYTTGLIMAIASRVQLSDNWSDIETAKVLRNQEVVSSGLYRYIRHPIYVGDLLLLVGLELSLNSWLVVAIGLMAPAILLQAVSEEKMLVEALPGYEAYCSRTKRFIPFIV